MKLAYIWNHATILTIWQSSFQLEKHENILDMCYYHLKYHFSKKILLGSDENYYLDEYWGGEGRLI